VLLRTILKFFVPGSIIFAGALLIRYSDTLSPIIPILNTLYPYAVLFVGIFLGWRFSRSRLIFVIIILAFADRVLRSLTFGPEDTLMIDQTTYNVLTFLVPLNIAVIAFLRERGIFTIHGLGRLGVLLVQPFFIYTMIKYRQLAIFKFLNFEIFRGAFWDGVAIPRISIFLYILALIFTVVNFIFKKDVIEGGFFWVLLISFFAFLSGEAIPANTFYLSTAALILIMSILEYSHNVAFRDELTGLPARRSLNEFFLKLPNRYAIAMIDIDKFKSFNDNYGHDIGDQVLRMVASRLSKAEGGGKPFRYGGEEFTLIFPGKTALEASQFAEELRKDVANKPFYIRSAKRPRQKPDDLKSAPRSVQGVRITISIGIAERDENNDDPQDVLKAADQALLKAKKTGRDQVRVFGKAAVKKT
jgi:diguanylate cyclase (GGDEF)-like protein